MTGPGEPIPTRFAPAERASDEELRRQVQQSFENPLTQAVLESVSGFALVLNRHRQVLAANREALQALGMGDGSSATGQRPGELFHCIHAQDAPGGCGTSEACTHCGAVLAILAAQTTGAPASGECLLSMERDGLPAAGEFKVRCTPLRLGGEGLLLFLLQDISGQKRREALERVLFHEIQSVAGGLDGSARRLLEHPEHSALTARQIQGLSSQLSQEVLGQRILLSAEDGTLAAEMADVDVQGVLDEIRAIFERHESAHGRRLVLEAEPGASLRTDQVLLIRVLVSLAKNALEAVPEGGTATVRFESREGEPRFVVHNPGTIPPEVAPRIFQRSFSTKARRGRGLGAFGAKLLTEKYLGGRLDFTSDAEAGTRFILHLAGGGSEVAASAPALARRSAERAAAVSGLRGTVLVVDDSAAVRQILSSILSQEHQVLLASNGEEALRMASELLPDLVLLDVVMPGLDGYAVCSRLKADPRTEEIPVLLLSTMGSETDETLALEAGAIDFVTKPLSPLVVAARVRNHMELKRSRDRLKALSLLDGLTGIANRRRFDEQLDAEWRQCLRMGKPLSVVLGDVDFFKRYNDGYGHILGDVCLKAVAGAFAQSLLRPGDLAARYGGEEFACILRDTDLQGAQEVAERLRASVAALELPHAFSPVAPFVTVSLGVASCLPENLEQLPALLDAADRKLYEAKASGRNRVCA